MKKGEIGWVWNVYLRGGSVATDNPTVSRSIQNFGWGKEATGC